MQLINYNKEIKRIKDKIVKEYKPEKIILFGSLAWGKPRRDSDVDLFVVKKTNQRRLDRERKVSRILFGYDFPAIDVTVYTPGELKKRQSINDPFVHNIITKGKILYAKQNTAGFNG